MNIFAASLLIPRRYASLLAQLVRRDIAGRYRGSLLGALWLLLLPLVMLAIYTFVFSFVFKARWNIAGAGDGGIASYGVVLFSGLMLHSFFSEVLSRSTGVILQNVNFVKKVVFPLEIFPYILTGTAVVHLLISIAILLLVHLALGGALSFTIVLFPIVLAPLMLLLIGLGWWLSSLGVYLRDIGQVIQLLMTILLFLSPIFYPLEMLPEAVRPLLYLNPLTVIVEQFRMVMLEGKMPDWQALGIYTLVSAIVFFSGFWWFEKTRRGFADVL